MRRARRDIQLGRTLQVLQLFEDLDTGDVWRVWQIHRADCHVELTGDAGQRRCIRFSELRNDYRPATTGLEASCRRTP